MYTKEEIIFYLSEKIKLLEARSEEFLFTTSDLKKEIKIAKDTIFYLQQEGAANESQY